MQAQTYTIVEKRKDRPFGRPQIIDFVLQRAGTVAADRILSDPGISLYTLDLDARRAIFVRLPPEVNLSVVPFYFVTQYEQANQVLTLSFEEMIQLAQGATIDDARMVFIHSVGRSGSTLASQLFAQAEGVVNLSEPDALSWLVVARYDAAEDPALIKQLVDATMRLLCKTPAPTAWVIKGRSFWIELEDLLHELFPQARRLFLYRDADSWLASAMRAYYDDLPQTAEAMEALIADQREWLLPLTPLLVAYDDERPLSLAGVITFMWLGVMDRYLALHAAGITMRPIRYEQWLSDPRATAEMMLRYCRIDPATVPTLDETLQRDAQAGSGLARSAVSQHSTQIRPEDLEMLHYLLSRHPVIKTADFVVPGI